LLAGTAGMLRLLDPAFAAVLPVISPCGLLMPADVVSWALGHRCAGQGGGEEAGGEQGATR